MEQLHFITKLLDIKDPNIQIMDVVNKDTHKEIIAKLDYDAPSCPDCGNQMKKYDFQKSSKIPYLETTGMPTRILLRKRRFKCYQCSKMMVSETSLVKKNHQIPRIINPKIAQKLIEKTSMTDIARQLAISTSTVIRKLNDFRFKHDFSRLPEIMSKDKEKIVNALQLPYSNAKLEATNNLIKLIKRNAFGFRNFENFKKRIFIALNIKKERTKFVLSRS
ncbi:transposase [Streptococcus halitosis]|uniref:transposase n=1 Tax=Streptococcus halitosis TaxID=2172545 RepID=UPI0020059EA4|nr:transposase [Streptococcus halitosis]MCK6129100.1 transposase [Streptococcus halitosis]MCK6216103.1 transposase [Streptococcus halitosis]